MCYRRRNQWLRLALALFCLPLMWLARVVYLLVGVAEGWGGRRGYAHPCAVLGHAMLRHSVGVGLGVMRVRVSGRCFIAMPSHCTGAPPRNCSHGGTRPRLLPPHSSSCRETQTELLASSVPWCRGAVPDLALAHRPLMDLQILRETRVQHIVSITNGHSSPMQTTS